MIDAGWSNYLSVEAESAATLTGLVFVAVSINLARVLAIPGLTGRAAESLMQLFGVVIISTVALIPRQPVAVQGIEIGIFALVLLVVQVALQIRYLAMKTGHPRWWAVMRMIQTLFAAVPFCVAGILLAGGSDAGLYWLAPGCIFSMMAGVLSAWVLLVEILR